MRAHVNRLSSGLRLLALAAASTLSACSVDDRRFDAARGDAGGEILSNEPNPGGLPPGSVCTEGGSCSTGFCADGVCCESACDAPCAQCSSEGKCDVVPLDDAACPALTCAASTECVQFTATASSGRCLSLGQCRTECEGTPIAEGQLCSLGMQPFETRCDDGDCVDARMSAGGACVVDAECSSGQCVDSVCCAEACDGSCEVCSPADGSCVAVDPSSPDSICGEDGRTCAGRGECLLPLGRECSSAAECVSGQCIPAVIGASSLCCAEACSAGQLCSSAGACIDPVADLGESCQSTADCSLGHCVDGVCCDSACDGVCERCDAPGATGRCVADAPETACDGQAPARRCLSRGLCQLPNGEACAGNEDCGSGRCERALDGGRICCAVTCEAGVQACAAGGAACQTAPLGNGNACTNDGECISGSCEAGRCCPSDCGGACEVCSVRGVCEIPPAGSAGCPEIDCASQDTECRTFASIGNPCEAVGDCKELADCPFTNTAQGTECQLATGGRGRCDGSGACEPLPQSEICGAVPLPAPVTPLAPMRGSFTGSMRAPAARQTLRPLLVWSASSTQCPAGSVSYQVQLDNSCQPGALASCAFSSPELDTSVTQAQLRPSTDLPVQSQVPVGAFYAWRVRACDPAARCSAWSDVAYLHVGRTPHDLNGDGFADLLAGNTTIDLYLGGAQFDSRAEQQFTLSNLNLGQNARFAGDLNGDGFADVGLLENDFAVCGSSGLYPVVVFGGPNPSSLQRQVFCAAAGSPSVLFQIGNVGDLNGDGFDDLAFAREFSGQGDAFRVVLGGSTVSSTAEVDLDISIPSENGAFTVSYPHTATTQQSFDGAGDFNADGFADVVLTGDGRRGAGLFRQRLFLGGSTLSRSFASSSDITGCLNPYVAKSGDITGDGRDDWGVICSLPSNGSRFGVIRGGNALASTLSDGFDSTVAFRAMSRSIDLDSDGTLDVIILRQTNSALVWRRGLFNPAAPTTLNQLSGGTLLGTADHNGDGRTDLFTWENGISPSWVPAGASLNVTPVRLVPFSGTTAPPGIVF